MAIVDTFHHPVTPSSPRHTFRIKTGSAAYEGEVLLDGQPLRGVQSVSFELSANKPTYLHLVVVGEIVVEGEFCEEELLHVSKPNRF